jgi:hypothetical protein
MDYFHIVDKVSADYEDLRSVSRLQVAKLVSILTLR